MSVAYLISPLTGARVTIQVANNLRKSLSSKIVNNPVASLETVTDHIVVNPRRFSVSGLITEGYLGDSLGYLTPVNFDTELESIINSRQPFSFYLNDETFTNVPDLVAIADYTVTKTDKEGGVDFKVTLELQEVFKGSLAETITLPASSVSSLIPKKADAGSGTTKDASTAEKDKAVESNLRRTVGSI